MMAWAASWGSEVPITESKPAEAGLLMVTAVRKSIPDLAPISGKLNVEKHRHTWEKRSQPTAREPESHGNSVSHGKSVSPWACVYMWMT